MRKVRPELVNLFRTNILKIKDVLGITYINIAQQCGITRQAVWMILTSVKDEPTVMDIRAVVQAVEEEIPERATTTEKKIICEALIKEIKRNYKSGGFF